MPFEISVPGRRHFRRLALVLGLAALAWSGGASAGQTAASNEQLFGTEEIHSTNLQMFPKWRGTIDRYAGEQKTCDPAKCHLKEWQALVERLRGKDLMTELREVNREMNAKPYITDPVNWNLPDYWATPFQFLRKDGDCEDYAIAKYMALRNLGVSVDDMRIVVLQDMNLGIAHAILAVYIKGTPYILDNQISTVIPAKAIHHYKPVYSVNENGWWLHRS